MDQQTKGKELTQQEETELREGQALYEMTQSTGWQVVKKWLEDRSLHLWVDPRTIDQQGGLSKAEWEWRELNGFHASNTAKELLEKIDELISKADYMAKIKSGEISVKGFKI